MRYFLGFLYNFSSLYIRNVGIYNKKVCHIMGHLDWLRLLGYIFCVRVYKYQTKVVLLHNKIDILYHNYKAFLHNRKAYTIIPPIKYSLQLFLIFKSI